MLKIHGAPLSNFSRKVFLALEWKGVDYEMIHTQPGDTSDAFGAISPLRKIPVLEDDGFFVPDSSVILHYIDRRFPDRPLCPQDPQKAAEVLFVEEFIDTETFETVGAIWVESWLKPNFMALMR